jgi:hypothetical protein
MRDFEEMRVVDCRYGKSKTRRSRSIGKGCEQIRSAKRERDQFKRKVG